MSLKATLTLKSTLTQKATFTQKTNSADDCDSQSKLDLKNWTRETTISRLITLSDIMTLTQIATLTPYTTLTDLRRRRPRSILDSGSSSWRSSWSFASCPAGAWSGRTDRWFRSGPWPEVPRRAGCAASRSFPGSRRRRRTADDPGGIRSFPGRRRPPGGRPTPLFRRPVTTTEGESRSTEQLRPWFRCRGYRCWLAEWGRSCSAHRGCLCPAVNELGGNGVCVTVCVPVGVCLFVDACARACLRLSVCPS